ncbi:MULTISPECIES: DUF5992 family protein [unclassified Roseateles]|uniref:DUF5992 family protein n=1 Tax=unclassified Roseateles TaxID=2626991 RepID=UPI000A4FBFCA|nr:MULTISPECIES: DUF5992 family protein [unclassified Roseateles]
MLFSRRLPAILFCVFGALALGGKVGAASTYIIMDGTIIDVANTVNGMQAFAVLVAGATGPCSMPTPGKQGAWIIFPENKAQSPATHRMAQQLAMLALATGKKVRIANYQDASCFGASFISISNGPSSTD